MFNKDPRKDTDTRLGPVRTAAAGVLLLAATGALAAGISSIPESTTPEQTGVTTTSGPTLADLGRLGTQEQPDSTTTTDTTTTTLAQEGPTETVPAQISPDATVLDPASAERPPQHP